MEERKWFVIHTYSGYENKVKANIEHRAETMGLKDKIFQILIPMEEVLEFKGGKERLVQKKIFPGYVLIEMILTDASWLSNTLVLQVSLAQPTNQHLWAKKNQQHSSALGH